MLTFVIPCFNEEKNISELYARLSKILTDISNNSEVIFVDDGSTDNTLNEIKKIHSIDKRVHYLSFSRNFGQQSALLAGIHIAKGDAVITLDADLQHPVSLIPLFIKEWKSGYEIVQAQRINTTNINKFKRFSSIFFYKTINFISDINLAEGCSDFRLLDKRVIKALCRLRENNFFFRGIISWCGFKTKYIPYTANERYTGKSQYSIKRMTMLAFDGITAFTIKPLRLSILLSMLFVLFAIIEIIYVLYITLYLQQAISGWASLMILVSILGAMILLMLGIIGEYIGRIFIQVKERPSYIIRESA